LSNSASALLQLAVDGHGIIIMPSFGVHEELKRGRVEAVLTDWELASFSLHVRYPSRRFLPAKVRRFLEALRAHFGDDPNADIWWPE
jgi:DNA-binding transcriptional LysR family regulator